MTQTFDHGRLHVRAQRMYRRIALAIFNELPNGDVQVVDNITLRIAPDGYIGEGAISLPEDALQELMDDLWREGIRPSRGVASAGQVEAMQEHLKDLRTVLWHTLKMEAK